MSFAIPLLPRPTPLRRAPRQSRSAPVPTLLRRLRDVYGQAGMLGVHR